MGYVARLGECGLFGQPAVIGLFALRGIMDDSVQKSCWGITAKAVVGFGVIILIAWLVGGAETAAVVAAG